MSKQVEPIAKCPGCGVPMDALDLHVSDGYICLLRQRDAERAARVRAEEENVALKAENEQLRAAIATPEVYAGVVSEVVEKERDEAVVRLTATEAENAVLKAEVERLERHRRQAQDRADSCEYAREVDGLLREIQGSAMQEADYQKERAKKAEAIIKTANRRYAKSIGKEEMLSSAEQEEAMLHHVLEMENTIVWDAVSPEDASKMDVVNEYRERAEKAEKEVKRLARFATREAAEQAKGGE